MKTDPLLSKLAETAAAALDLKARVLRRGSRRKIAREVFERQEAELEEKLVGVLEPLFERQIRETSKRLLEMAPPELPKGSKARPTHDPLAALAFDAKDPRWRSEMIDRTLPVLALGMLEGMTAEMMEVGIDPKNLTKRSRTDEEGHWVTTSNGARLFIGEDGVARTGPTGKIIETEEGKPPVLKFVPPPEPKGKAGGKAGGFTATGHTNTEVGDAVEAASNQVGFVSALEEGKRQGPFDLAFEGNPEFVFECKACTTSATEYKAKPKKSEMEAKRKYAKNNGLKACTMIAVVDMKSRRVDFYWREGIGAFRLSKSGRGWNYAGRAKL